MTKTPLPLGQQQKYMKRSDVAKRYGVTRTTVYRWVKEGRIPEPVDIAGTPLWKISDLDRFEQELSSDDSNHKV